MRTNRRTFPAAEIAHQSDATPLDFGDIFGRAAPLEIDLGCGDGAFLAAMAAQYPERNFVGVELSPSRIRAACRKIGDGQLPNARVLRGDILEVLRTLVPPEAMDVCHLLFSDPWPKRRHHDRRVANEEFFRAAAVALKPDGLLRIATDHADYFAHMQRVLQRCPFLTAVAANDVDTTFATTFESRFRASGAEIHRLLLRKS